MNSDNAFRIISKDGEFWLDKDGWTFSLTPPESVKIILPPDVEGIGWFISNALSLKGINSGTMKVLFSESLFLGCDARLSYIDSSFAGWTYSLHGEFLKFNNFRKIWICPQMRLYFESPPKNIYVSLEGDRS